jgi:dienelactone hydrolase
VKWPISLLLPLLMPAVMAMAEPPTTTKDTVSVDIAGYAESVDIYRPAIGSSGGVAIVAHGFTRSRVRHRDLGRALAEAGVTAVIPDLPNVVDLWGNGDAIVDLVRQVEAGTLTGQPFERSKLVLIGTSAGGLATILAAAKTPGLAGWVGLDPVDRTGTGTDAAARFTAPAVVLLGGASSCNLFSSGRTIARALPHLLRSTALKDASHCDFEDPTTNLCRVLCGGSSEEMQVRIRDETVRATLELLSIATANAVAVPTTAAPPITEAAPLSDSVSAPSADPPPMDAPK